MISTCTPPECHGCMFLASLKAWKPLISTSLHVSARGHPSNNGIRLISLWIMIDVGTHFCHSHMGLFGLFVVPVSVVCWRHPSIKFPPLWMSTRSPTLVLSV